MNLNNYFKILNIIYVYFALGYNNHVCFPVE